MTGAVIDKAAGVDISFTDNKNRGGARYRAALGLLMGVERTRQMMKIGFIGTGNMGGALASAAARSGEVEVLLANRTKAKAETLAERIGAVVSSNEIIAREADHIFLGVKPQMIVDVLKGIAPALKERKSAPVLISMVTGPDIARIQELAGGDYPVIRIMPNTACAVGQGVLLVCANANVTAQELAGFEEMMEHSGVVDRIDEKLIDAASAVSGCGPAYVHRGACRRRRQVRSAAREGDTLRRADAARQRRNGAPVRQAPGAAEGRGMQPRRKHHRGRRRA